MGSDDSHDSYGHSQDRLLCRGHSTLFCIELPRSSGELQLTLRVQVQCER
jgi:hypothetical protein